MRSVTLIITATLVLVACGTTPPPPPPIAGEYRPVNEKKYRAPDNSRPLVFDFKYKGDPEFALNALQRLQPQLTIKPASGVRQRPGFVDVDLRQVTLDQALHKLGEQGKTSFEVIYRPDPANAIDSAFIKYLP